MWAYLLRRLAAGFLVLLVLSFGVFLLVALSGDPLAQLRANPQISPATIAAAAAQLHLNQPLVERYWGWLTGLLVHGSLGTSYTGQPVGPQIAQRLAVTLKLVVPAVILSLLLGVVVGVVSAVRQYRPVDHVSTGLAYLFFSTPVFVVGYVLAYVFALQLEWLPVQGFTPISQGLIPFLRNLILPSVALGLVYMALIARITRATMLDVLSQDYVRTAKAKGVGQRDILFVHALKNAAVPIVTIVGIGFASLIGGAVVTESVFAIPGLGRLTVDAILRRDYPVIQGVVLLFSFVYVLVNLGVDLLYTLFDPRIRY